MEDFENSWNLIAGWFEEEILFDMSKSREAEVFRVAITFLKQQSVESNAFF